MVRPDSTVASSLGGAAGISLSVGKTPQGHSLYTYYAGTPAAPPARLDRSPKPEVSSKLCTNPDFLRGGLLCPLPLVNR